MTHINPCAKALASWHEQQLSQAGETSLADACSGGGRIGVAYSGGADSTALLLAAINLWGERVVALHVNHGLQAAEDAFEQHARTWCETHHIECRVANLQVAVAAGDSHEERARVARYQALAQLANGAGASHTHDAAQACTVVLLAQHAQDQLETMLIALSRGAGLPGLSAMAAQFERHGQRFVRPILGIQATAIRQWLVQSGHRFVDDPSNADTSYTRNRIRAQVLPALEQALPGVAQAVARSAEHAAQAQGLLQELAALDALETGLPPGIKALQTLQAASPARCANVLRHWLAHTPGATPSAAQLQQLMQQVQACTTRGHAIDIKVGQGHVRRDGEKLTYSPPII
jgi:tRNA(Ile)-lysidine synthase